MRPYRTLSLLLLLAAGAVAPRADAADPPKPPPAPAKDAPKSKDTGKPKDAKDKDKDAAAKDAASNVDAAAGERARKLLTEGARLYDEGKFSQAYVAFLAAWAINQTSSLAKNLADCELAMGKHRDAADHLRYVVKNQAGDAKPEDVKRAQLLLDDTVKKIGTLRVTVNIDGAAISIDGTAVGSSPIRESFYVAPGPHTVEAKHERYEPVKNEIELKPGATKTLRLTLKPSDSAPPGTPGSEPSSVRPWIIRGGLALTVVGIAVGATTAALANKKAGEAAALRTQLGDKPVCAGMTQGVTATNCAKLRDTGASQSSLANASLAMFLVGGVAALGTAGLWTATVLGNKDQGPMTPLTGLRVVPTFDAHQAGAVFVGRF